MKLFQYFALLFLCFISFKNINLANSTNDFYPTYLSLAVDNTRLFDYDDPSISPDGNFIAWTAHHKLLNDYFDPSKIDDPLQLHSAVLGTKIYIGGNTIDTPIEISIEGKSCWSPSWAPDGNAIAY